MDGGGLALRNLLIRGRDRDGRPAVVLVEAGLGEMAAGARFRELYGVTDPAGRLLAELAAAGVAPGDVTHVVYTHLHFDHVAGGVTSGGDDGGGPRIARHGWLLLFQHDPHVRTGAGRTGPDRHAGVAPLAITARLHGDEGRL